MTIKLNSCQVTRDFSLLGAAVRSRPCGQMLMVRNPDRLMAREGRAKQVCEAAGAVCLPAPNPEDISNNCAPL